jgi:phage-related protein
VSSAGAGSVSRRWRYYRTAAGGDPVRAFLASLDRDDAIAVRTAMYTVRVLGLSAARHLEGDIYEVRAARAGRAWRVLFATEGRTSQVLLAVSGFEKKTRKTPPAELELARRRLRDWRSRART